MLNVEAEKIYQQKFLPEAKYLLKELEYYGNSQFRKQTEASKWTIGQIYHHIIQGTYDYHFKAIHNCIEEKGGANKGGKTILGFLVFTFNSFPIFKLKSAQNYTPIQIENTSKAQDMMFGYIKEMHKLALEIDKKGKSRYKVKHRNFGRLTAIEWYTLIEIHQRHHIKQKQRIDKIIRVFKKDEVFEDSTEIV